MVAGRFRPVSVGRAAFYRLSAMSASNQSASLLEVPESAVTQSARVAEARSRAGERLRRQRQTLRPLGIALIAAVVVSAITGHPAPGLHGKALGVTLAVCAFAGALAPLIRDRFSERGYGMQAALIAATGAAGVALVALQPRGASELAGGAAVWMAITRLPLLVAVTFSMGITVALDLAAALSGGSAAAVVAITLLCALLGLVAYFLQRGRKSQEQTELLLAQLEDAREQQLQTAAIAERGRIASELHDVLAHSLSGAAIQLQGARMLAENEQASAKVRAAIERASELVKDGLANARQAVGALRGEELPNIAQLESLVESYRDDMHLDVTLTIEGNPRSLSTDASLALYRGAQEALTNVARYAPAATTTVLLRYEDDRAIVSIEDHVAASALARAHGHGLAGVGGGHGLAGLRERLERAGGSMQAGPTENGWRVELDMPT
jgi:signal transduction histidine kinase